MGTDIYLEWDGMTDEEKEAQITGFSIRAGDKGYLRASIGMVLENSILREIFPREYWESSEPLEYNFQKRSKELPYLLKIYISAVLGQLTDKELMRILNGEALTQFQNCLLYTSPSPRDISGSRMPSSA